MRFFISNPRNILGFLIYEKDSKGEKGDFIVHLKAGALEDYTEEMIEEIAVMILATKRNAKSEGMKLQQEIIRDALGIVDYSTNDDY